MNLTQAAATAAGATAGKGCAIIGSSGVGRTIGPEHIVVQPLLITQEIIQGRGGGSTGCTIGCPGAGTIGVAQEC